MGKDIKLSKITICGIIIIAIIATVLLLNLKSTQTKTLTLTVPYSNMKSGTEYTLSGALQDSATGEILQTKENEPITATKAFIPETMEGEVNLTFDVPLKTIKECCTDNTELLYKIYDNRGSLLVQKTYDVGIKQ